MARTQQVTITLPARNVEPPVYIAGSFTKTPWEPEEMQLESEASDAETRQYTRTFDLQPGEYQYKFRLGHGDWWICDENGTIVKDESGNSNNRLVVPAAQEATPESSSVTSKSGPMENTEAEKPEIPSDPAALGSNGINDDDDIEFDPSTLHIWNGEEDESLCKRPEGFLGSWEPDSQITPNHRRASTNLGFKISRIGTLLPPEPTAEDLENAEAENSAVEEEDLMSEEEDVLNKPKASSTAIGKQQESSQSVPSLDRTTDGGILFMPKTSTLNPSRMYGKASNPEVLYTSFMGTGISHKLNTQLDVKRATEVKKILPTAAYDTAQLSPRERTRNRRGSNAERQPLLGNSRIGRKKPSEPKTLTFFAIVATWFHRMWFWLFGGSEREQNRDLHDETPQNGIPEHQ